MKTIKVTILIILFSLVLPGMATAQTEDDSRTIVEKVLFVGDSMTGWLAERLGAYGKQNGFEVATVVWDGSTISKWGATRKLSVIVEEQKPDAVFVSLGMNDLFEMNPESRLSNSLLSFQHSIGEIPIVWIGPPSWPGQEKGKVLDEWLADKLGEGHYFSSFEMTLPRQSAKNPHPTRAGMITWMDAVIEWVQADGAVRFNSIEQPVEEQMTRGKTFIYKRMKETL